MLLICSAGIDFIAARQMDNTHSQSVRRSWLTLSLTVNLGFLLYFKYLLFIVDNAVVVMSFLGFKVEAPVLNIVLPLGISFYTFQTISYVVDVYRRHIPAKRDFLLYGCFVTFFPQLVAGPILRGNELLDQLAQKPMFRPDMFASGLRRILLGLFLKVVIADNVAPLVEEGFAMSAEKMSAIDVITLSFLFGFQIYCDFSAYSHIAIGSARLMGIRFPENFDFPYISRSPKEFWQRWHISLSSWVRDYLYLPLIGAKTEDSSAGGMGGAAVTRAQSGRQPVIALFVAWMIMGLWHGANWTFVFWGVYHAFFIFLYRVTEPQRLRLPTLIRNYGGWAVTLPIIMLSWIPFRANDIDATMRMLAVLTDTNNYTWLGMRENNYLVSATLMVGFLLTWLAHCQIERWRAHSGRIALALEAVFMGAVGGLVFVFLRPMTQFIYFQF